MTINTNSSYFLTPAVGLGYQHDIYTPEHIGVFLGDLDDPRSLEDLGSTLTFIYSETNPTLDEFFTARENFERKYLTSKGYTAYVFKVYEPYKESVVSHFLDGRYSQIDRDYVEKHFPKTSTRLTVNRQVLDKSPVLRKMWERKLDVTLPPEAEVWSKPRLEVEIHGYAVSDDGIEPSAS